MRSILEEFAYGNISPEVQYFKQDSEMGQAVRAAAVNEKNLLEKLNGEEKEIFEKFVDSQGEIIRLTAVKNLIYGYKLGVMMIAEAFVTSNELIAGED